MRKTISILCAAVLCCVLLLPLGASASKSNCIYYLNQKYDMDAIQAEYPYYVTIHAQILTSDTDTEYLYYFFFADPIVGYRNIDGIEKCRFVYVHNDSSTYGCSAPSASGGSLTFKNDETYGDMITAHLSSTDKDFYYSRSGYQEIIEVSSNFAINWSILFNLGSGSTGNQTTNNWTYFGTLNTISSYAPSGYEDTTDPTEPATTVPPSDSSSDSSGSSAGIPDDWISGGETLAPTELATLPSELNLDSAMEQLETMDYTIDSNVLSAVGGFWHIFDLFLDSTGLMWVVLISMLVILLAWLLGRRV